MTTRTLPTPTELRKLLSYNPATGEFIWRHRPDGANTFNARYAGKPAFTSDDGNGYRTGGVNGRKYQAHRVAYAIHWGHWPLNQIDHINGRRDDNRIENLRDVTCGENLRNARLSKNNRSGFVGVSWHGLSQKWQAYIWAAGKGKNLGHFTNIDDAVEARRLAAVKYGYHANHGKRRLEAAT